MINNKMARKNFYVTFVEELCTRSKKGRGWQTLEVGEEVGYRDAPPLINEPNE